MNTRLLLCLLTGTVVATAGCIERVRVEFYNDSGSAISLIPSDQQECRMEAGQVCRFWYVRRVLVKGGNVSREVEIPPVLGGLEAQQRILESRGWSERVMRLRLTSTGDIHMVTPGGNWGQDLSPQPSGYPIRLRVATN